GEVAAFALLHLRIRIANRLFESGLQRLPRDPPADRCATAGKRADIGDVEHAERAFDALIEPARREKIAVRLGGGGEAAWHAHPEGGELSDHLAERCILPPDPRDV